jgi:hypothetical protein
MEELQEALEAELGRQHRLKDSQLSAALGKVLAVHSAADLGARVRKLRVAVRQEEAAALLHSCPYLVVQVDPSDVPARLDALAAACGTGRAAVIALCSRTKSAARLLTMHPGNTQRKVEVLCSILQLGPEELLEKCCKYPRVLQVKPGDMLARAAALGTGLGLDAEEVAELCRQNPDCLGASPGAVNAAVEAVMEALEVSREEAVQLCLRHPAVLQKSASTIVDNANALKGHLGQQGVSMVRRPPRG